MRRAPDPRYQNEILREYEFTETGVLCKAFQVASWNAIESEIEVWGYKDDEEMLIPCPWRTFTGQSVFLKVPVSEIKRFLATTEENEWGHRVPK